MEEYKTVVDRDTGELKRVPINQQKPVEPAPISADDLAKLDAMSRGELLELVHRMARQCGLVARMSEEETAQAMLDTLAQTALKPIVMGLSMKADIDARLKAVDKWLDRTQGKAIQRIDQRILNVNKGMAGEMTTPELLAALRDIKTLPSGVTLLEDGTLDIGDEEEPTTIDQ